MESWKKGEVAKTQSEVYTRLGKGMIVVFYQEGNQSSKDFKIEIATDAVPFSYYAKNYKEIMTEVERNSRGRQICRFNL